MTDEQRIRKIEQVLEQLRPNIQMDGGDITFVKYVDGVVYVKLHGACAGCALSTQTLKMGWSKRCVMKSLTYTRCKQSNKMFETIIHRNFF